MELWNRGSSACTLTWSFVCSQNLTQHASRTTHGSTETKGHRSDVRARKPNEQGLKTWVTLIEAHWQQVNISLQEYSVTRGACSSHWEKKRHRRSLNWSRNDSSFAGTLRKWAWRSKEKKKHYVNPDTFLELKNTRTQNDRHLETSQCSGILFWADVNIINAVTLQW